MFNWVSRFFCFIFLRKLKTYRATCVGCGIEFEAYDIPVGFELCPTCQYYYDKIIERYKEKNNVQ